MTRAFRAGTLQVQGPGRNSEGKGLIIWERTEGILSVTGLWFRGVEERYFHLKPRLRATVAS